MLSSSDKLKFHTKHSRNAFYLYVHHGDGSKRSSKWKGPLFQNEEESIVVDAFLLNAPRTANVSS
jgi:hypothetical protein